MFAYYARSSVRSCRRRWNREKTAGDATHNNAMRLCIYVLPVPPASAPCARRVAGGLSTRRAINLLTGDTLWEPVIGRKPENRLTGYRFTSLVTLYNEPDHPGITNVAKRINATAVHLSTVSCLANRITLKYLCLSTLYSDLRHKSVLIVRRRYSLS